MGQEFRREVHDRDIHLEVTNTKFETMLELTW